MKAQTFLSLLREDNFTQLSKEMALCQGGRCKGEREEALAHPGAVAVALRSRTPQTPEYARRTHADSRGPGPSSRRSLVLGVRRDRTAMSPTPV